MKGAMKSTTPKAEEPQFTLRSYAPDADFELMFPLVREIVDRPPYEAARRELHAYPHKELVAHLAVSGIDDVIGFCSATYPYWNAVAIVDYLVVSTAWRRKGVGAALVRATEERLSAAQVRRVCVQTAKWNTAGIRFYEHLGFSATASMPGYFGDEEELTMVWLDKALRGR
jgi:ribosomal protein S18 acetylase RimI-like enzyme